MLLLFLHPMAIVVVLLLWAMLRVHRAVRRLARREGILRLSALAAVSPGERFVEARDGTRIRLELAPSARTLDVTVRAEEIAGGAASPGGSYRVSPTRRPRRGASPAIHLHRERWLSRALGRLGVVFVVPPPGERRGMWLEGDAASEARAALAADARVREALGGLLDAGVTSVTIHPGERVTASVTEPREEQIEPLVLREIGGALATILTAVPPLAAPAPRRFDGTRGLVAAAVALVVAAPFAIGWSLTRWPSIDPTNSFEPRVASAGFVAGIAAWAVFGLPLLALIARARPGALRRVPVVVAALWAALPVWGAAIAVAANAVLDASVEVHPASAYVSYTEEGEEVRDVRYFVSATWWNEGPGPRVQHSVGTYAPAAFAAEAHECPEHAVVVIGRGRFGGAWLREVRCGPRIARPSPRPPPVSASTPGSATVEIAYAGEIDAPLPVSFFDVRLRNDAGEPRWFLFPRWVGRSLRLPTRTSNVQATRALGKGSVHLFEVDLEAQAVLLAAHAEVTVRGFRVYGGEPPSVVPFEVMVARRLTVDGIDVERWVVPHVSAASSAEVVDCRDACHSFPWSSSLSGSELVASGEERLLLSVPTR